MKTADKTQPWEYLAILIEQGETKRIEEFLDSLTPAETARAVSRLDEKSRTRLLTLLSAEEAADVLRDLPDEQAADLIEEISPTTAAAIVDRLDADEQADLLADVSESNAEAILDEMTYEDAKQARELLQYPDDTAGGLMITDYLSYPETYTIAEVLTDMEKHSHIYSDYQIQYVYITDTQNHLKGVMRLRDLLLAPRDKQIAALMVTDPIFVEVNTHLNRLFQVFEEHAFIGIPVVDTMNKLVGVVERSSVMEEWEKQTKNSFLQISGIIGGEEFRSMPIRERAARRLSWLVPNIALNIIAASVIALYQDTLQAAIALAVFLPIVSDMSGNSGNQAIAVSIRELALGLIKPGEFSRVFWKESWLGLFNGIILGVLLGSLAYVWKHNIYLGLVVGGALAINTVVSVLLGGSMPLFLRKLRIDPALASGPILTTITDMCGFFLVLSLATNVIDLL